MQIKLPEDKLFFKLSEINTIGLMSIQQSKQMLYKGKLNGIKNGKNWLVPKEELLRFIREEMVAS